MARRLIVIGVIAGLVTAGLCAAQPLRVPKSCPLAHPMKTRCCRMPPAQPTDAVKPQAPQVALVHAQLPLIAGVPPMPVAPAIPDAPVREVPTRTMVLRI